MDRQTPENTGLTPAAEASEFPFSTAEPETFQAEIVVSADGAEQRMLVTRSGPKRRIDYDYGDQNQRTVLQNDKKYLVSFRDRCYAENDVLPEADSGEGEPLVPQIQSIRKYAAFERLGNEGGLAKFKARMRGGDASEVLVYVDESLGLPVKQEYFSVNGEEKTLRFSIELRNVRREIDAGVFEIPPGFRETSIEEFRKLATRK